MHLAFCMKKFSPQAEIVEGKLAGLVAGGIVDHEFQKHDPTHGMKEVPQVILCSVPISKNQKLI